MMDSGLQGPELTREVVEGGHEPIEVRRRGGLGDRADRQSRSEPTTVDEETEALHRARHPPANVPKLVTGSCIEPTPVISSSNVPEATAVTTKSSARTPAPGG